MSNDSAEANTPNGGATDGTRDIGGAIWAKAKSFLPDLTNLYLQPLDPSSDMTFSDRIGLIFQSMRPVGEFLDLSKLNLPPLGHVTTRFGRNVETYLYNYFLLACIHLVLFSLVHFGSVLVLLCWVGLLWFLYVVKRDTINVGDKLRIDSNAKLIIAVVTGLAAIFIGNVSTLIISLCVFLIIVVGIHGVLRDDVPDNAVVV